MATTPKTFFGENDEYVARSEDLVDMRNGLRSICQRRNCLGAADLKEAIDTGDMRRGQNQRRNSPTVGGEQTTISRTPATLAGTAVMSNDEGYTALPPGAYTPIRSRGTTSWPSAPSSEKSTQEVRFCFS